MMRIFFAAAFLFNCLSAQAQTQSDANTLARFLADRSDRLAKSSMTLLYMETERPSPESFHIGSVQGVASRAVTEFRHLKTLAAIYSEMVAPEDKSITKGYLSSAVATMSTDKIAIDLLDVSMTKLKSPSVINEASNAKGLIEEMHREVRRVVATK